MTTRSDTTIRTATRDDADSIHAMILALARTTDDEDRIASGPADLVRHGFADEPLFHALIAERGGRPVGLCVYFYSFSTWLGEPGVYVQDLYVAEPERGSGLGRRLLAATAARGAREKRATHLRLTVDADNAAAIRFYERVGMQRRTREAVFHVGGRTFRELAGERR